MSFLIDTFLARGSLPPSFLPFSKQENILISPCEQNKNFPAAELAEEILNLTEIHVWHNASWSSQRKQQWLLGRLAAKEVVCRYLKRQFQQLISLKEILILSDQHGRPFVNDSLSRKLERSLLLSISHSGTTSAAIVIENYGKYSGIGVDIEFCNKNHEGLKEGGFSGVEQNILENIPEPDHSDWLLRAWCAKEALAKALGVGLLGNPFNIEIKNIDFKTGKIYLCLAGNLAKLMPIYSNGIFLVFTVKKERLTFAFSKINY